MDILINVCDKNQKMSRLLQCGISTVSKEFQCAERGTHGPTLVYGKVGEQALL